MHENIFTDQRPNGQIPTLMTSQGEGARRWVDTLAITMVAVYLAQMVRGWQTSWGQNIQRALEFIESRAYRNEIESFLVFQFNAFFPPDWEDTGFAIFLLARSGRLDPKQLGNLRDLLHLNTVGNGTGIWVKDPYTTGNPLNNNWDPTSSINILRLHYLLETDQPLRQRTEQFVAKHLRLEGFASATLYYSAPLAAFFACRLMADFPEMTGEIRDTLSSFIAEVRKAVGHGLLSATPFEKALLGYPVTLCDDGLIFHHGRRSTIWYGSPILHQLACMIPFAAPLLTE